MKYIFFLKALLFLLSPPDIRMGEGISGIRREELKLFHKVSQYLYPQFYPEPVSGEKRCAVLVGEFSDVKIKYPDGITFMEYLKEMFFRSFTEPVIFYPYPSMNEFYMEMSMGKFRISGDVFGIYPVSNTEACYGSGECNDDPTRCLPDQDGGTCLGALNFVKEVLTLADNDVDFSNFDLDHDGFVDCLIVVHAGYGGEQKCEWLSGCRKIWSLSYAFSGTGSYYTTHDEVKIDRFIVGPELTAVPRNGTEEFIDMGVYAHEFGHLLNLPDLYDTDLTSCGVGVYDLMGYGVHGPSPSYLSAWPRLKLGWAEVIDVNLEGPQCGYFLKSFLDGGKILRAWAYDEEEPEKEYFLAEFRPRKGLDEDLPSNGVLIWHIDENMSSNDNEWYPGNEMPGKHYMVALEQPDGLYELETTSSKMCKEIADEGDYFRPGDEFTPYSNPNSSYYGGRFTGVWIKPVRFPYSETEAMSIVFEANTSQTFRAPYIYQNPPDFAIMNEEYVAELKIDGNPFPDVQIIEPKDATFDGKNIRWLPQNAGKYHFMIYLSNCAGEGYFEWNVNVQRAKLVADETVPYCLIGYVFKDEEFLKLARKIRRGLLDLSYGREIVDFYYDFSRWVLNTREPFREIIVETIKVFLKSLFLCFYIPLFFLKKR